MIVPDPDRIPHVNRDHIPLDGSHNFEELSGEHPELDLLYRYLQEPDRFQREPLDLILGTSPHVFGAGPVTVDSTRLVLLDSQRSELIEYDLVTHEARTIAEMGSGPGDIQYPRDMILVDDALYIAREDMYISRFDCSTAPCEFAEALSLDFRPSSIAKTDDHFAVLSSPDIQQDEPNPKSVRLITLEGEPVQEFGDAYEAGDHTIIIWQFSRLGNVRYSSSTDQFVIFNGAFSYLYFYDATTLELTETYELPEVGLPEFKYYPMERRIQIPMNDYHSIQAMQEIGEGLLLFEIVSYLNYDRSDFETFGTTRDYHHNYYLLDPVSRKSYQIGGYERLKGEEQLQLFLTKAGLLIYNREDGSLEWVRL
ncbi:MAG: hypothetical protein WD355_06315 [Balneolaceae bacterium]